MRALFYLLFSLLLTANLFAQSPKSNYIKVSGGYLMVLKQGDSLFKELRLLALKENIPSASFTGLGFVNAEFGYFNAKKKEYKEEIFNNMELASLDGSIAWQNESPSIPHMAWAVTKIFVPKRGI